ncbi:MAG TPA: DsbA family protein [Acidimicrobiales bacterium]|nr:DsbA family protein [Acidimicrobiales bacterium]
MATTEFAVNWDYRCPFARNAHEHVVTALQAGAPWRVEFTPFSLSQVHVPEGGTDVWDDPSKARDLLAMQAGIVVRDQFPDRFFDTHLALFRARHDESLDLRDEAVVREVLSRGGVDADAVMTAIAEGWPMEQFRKGHEWSVSEYEAWGVPTFMVGDRAAFVRIMTRPAGDGELAQTTVARVVDAVGGWPEINELKHTTLSR